ncbi:excinuclease ABC, C subunit [Limnospira maxima CS-328]|uniref:UvrABC system protein C n=1 Tax=Limnospira maxima CS-328 TaxID=513049 RepID=B5W9W2_LIMMA|nr:excinuclease ABC subunit UvrC [Limnospira maxima]EDZ91685.1 excinuclease ABC, C subunit [Limnospira maxima CS-328]
MTIIPLIEDSDRLEMRLKEIPPVPGVYFMKDGNENILYIGKSKKLRSRVRSYFRDRHNHSHRINLMIQQVTDIEFIVTDTEAEALALEANLIKNHQPHFNVLLKDDKKYPYLCITWSEPYPRIFITRKRNLSNPKDRYYGPYVDTGLLRSNLQLVKRLFPLRQRPKPLFKDRPCLNYDIGRCPGVCQQMISPEDYHQIVQKVAMVFQGRTEELIKNLTAQMQQAAAELNFETAAKFRDRIQGLQSLNQDQKVSLPDETVSLDAIALATDGQQASVQLFQIRAGHLVGRLGFLAKVYPSETALTSLELGGIIQRVLQEHYQTVDAVEIPSEIVLQYSLQDGELVADWLSDRKGRKVTLITPQRQAKLDLIAMVERNANYELMRLQKLSDRHHQSLQDLTEILDLPDLPHRIEGYDISHIQGSDAVASRVVFIDGLPAKQHYRQYKIKNPDVHSGRSDDFASLAEVIGRRFRDYQNLEPQDKPDLIMIDGGKGQLSAVVKVLQGLDILEELKVISLAKRREEIFVPGESQPLTTHPEQPGVQLLRRLRDEAHRFAVSFHRNQRSKRMKRSHLDDIPGLGHHRQKLLLGHFRSIDYIRMATPTQLAEVPGIGEKLARQIYDYFHPST